jgi:hypothetical protein|tara:strand:- start:336 stop:740 length:405 start_codon:yes stop_codon:yes gene_type:complete
MTNQVDIRDKDLRNFGLSLGLMIGVVFGLLLPWGLKYSFPLLPWFFAGIIWLTAFIKPFFLKFFFLFTTFLGRQLGAFYMYIILAVTFYIVITPLGFLIQTFGSNPYERQLNKALPTYRKNSKVFPPEKMERPF